MADTLATLDWWIIGLYLLAMLGLAAWLGRQQGSRRDYYLGGGKLPSWALATSVVASQCLSNSLLGAPAFVGFVIGGGMLWLQYELAVPLAMLLLCALFLPVRRSGAISIYAFLEQRLGLQARLLASACFLVFRGVATGVTIYGVGSVLSLVTGQPFWLSVVLLMGVTIVYDVLGGMRAVVVSDVLQMGLLLLAVLLGLSMVIEPLLARPEAITSQWQAVSMDWGFSGNDYGFWPMVVGGLFLYMAYYGCDQSQAQRLLAAADERETQRVLLLNGLRRFPLVLAYCLLGLGLAAYAMREPALVASLPATAAGTPNYNLVFPAFVIREFEPGFAGLAIVGLFAAAMSSIDSALNSLSASTLEDFLQRDRVIPERSLFLYSKLLTLAWGLFAVALSFQVEHIAPTVLEAINKVGSMANGPLLGLFLIAIFLHGAGQRTAIIAFLLGLVANASLWLWAPQVSWLWWNVAGCVVALAFAVVASIGRRAHPVPLGDLAAAVPKAYAVALLLMAAVVLAAALVFSALAD